jgi:NAD(P)-dependent dehydrogenase (short-subunit alcohol dehydrogenase family)
MDIQSLFQIQGQTAVITGGSGVLGQAMAHVLADAGVRVAIISRRAETSGKIARDINDDGGQAIGIACDVTDRAALEAAHERVRQVFGSIDILINGAGGNQPQATTAPGRSFFALPTEAIEGVFHLNFTGTVLSSQIFGRDMAERGQGCIVNIASMSSLKPLTNVPIYSAAKAAIVNFTQWLAVHMAQEYSTNIRVNAMAPGFFLTAQNRFLLTDKDSGEFTTRGQKILAHTPAGRMGVPEDLISTLIWLVSPGSAFVTGIVVPVDGGFSAFGGV